MGKLRAPRAGSKLAWLADKLQHSNAELVELARQANLHGLTLKVITRMRSVLSTKYKIKSSSTPSGAAPTRPTAAAARRAADQPDARQLKRSALRKLVFELGFDDAREIFEEFLAMHHRMGGNGS